MPFTTQELENIANSTLEFFMNKGDVAKQAEQDKPLLAKMRASEKTFPGGKDIISLGVTGLPTTTVQGFESDDTVGYANPANNRRAKYPWKLLHWGIQFTMHELAIDGISIVDSTSGSSERSHSEREMMAIANLLEEKYDDMTRGSNNDLNRMYWLDGTQDSKLIPGIKSFVVDNPSSSIVVGGIDQGANTWWRNRANLNISLGSTVSDLAVVHTLQNELRQLRRFGGRPNYALAGSDMIDRLEKELRSKGNYTDTGFSGKKVDLSLADLTFKGIDIMYDPTLDDIGESKRLYLLDTTKIHPMVIQGEKNKKHTPARPENKYVFYRAVTYMGGLVCKQRNANGVYAFA